MALSVATLSWLVAVPVNAAVENVSGTIVMRERIALTPAAVAIVTLTDRSKDGAGTIIGQQRIDAPPSGTIPFSVPFERDTINAKHAYSVYASIVDGGQEWQSPAPVPTITGGPTENLTVEVASAQYMNPASISGTIALPNGVQLTPAAVAYAAILNADSGRLVSRQVIPSPATFPIPFVVGYDADLVDPAAHYVAAAAVIDGTVLWQTDGGLPIAPDAVLDLNVVQRNQPIPGPASPAPSGEATPTSAATTPPTGPTSPPGSATPQPTRTARPTPTLGPTATPTTAPATATPTAAATATAAPATPTPAPTATPLVTPSPPTPPPATSNPTSVSGTLVYREGAQLTSEAVAEIAVVQVIGRNGTVVVVGRQQIVDPGQQPIAFNVPLDQAVLDTTVDTELWALITDGSNAWTTPEGVFVATNGAPSQNVLVPLTFRPDVLEGEVTGTIVGAGPGLSGDAIAITWVLNATTLAIVGFDDVNAAVLDPIPFSVPFSVTNLEANQGYIATSFVYDGESTWDSDTGVPVITNGNPLSDVTVTVAQVTPFASASPSPSVAVTPAPTAAPTPPASGGGGIDPLWILLIGAAIGGVVIGAIYVMRRGNSS
jgi:uncharacterized lipoprotein YbaY